MNAARQALAELSDLPIEFDPNHWIENLADARHVFEALDYVYKEQLARSLDQSNTKEERVYRKLSRALIYFQRSFTKSHESWQSVVTLAIALETMVTDSYSAGVQARVVRRLGLLLAEDSNRD